MASSKIEWTDATWNPVTGCYARRMAQRLAGRYGYPKVEPFRVTCHIDRMGEPASWKKPRRVFVCSMSDFFHRQIPPSFRYDIFRTMQACEWHTFLVLTKRTDELLRFCKNWPSNIQVGVTVESAQYVYRIDDLRKVHARVRFLSCEPLLGPLAGLNLRGIHWVVVGGETGPGARPMDLNWARDIRDQCKATGVAFFYKGAGGRKKRPGYRLLDGVTHEEMCSEAR